MAQGTTDFYDLFADHYHLIVDDWEAELRQAGEELVSFLPPNPSSGPILDCACGVGTQALGLAALGYRVDGSDLSPGAVARILKDSAGRGLALRAWVDDMRTLAKAPQRDYQAILCMANAIAHLDDDADVLATLRSIHAHIRPGGKVILSFRDYEPYRGPGSPAMPPPAIYSTPMGRRIFFQVWDWVDDRHYLNHVYMSQQDGDAWKDLHLVSPFRVHLPGEVAAMAEATGFTDIRSRPSGSPGREMITVVGTRPA